MKFYCKNSSQHTLIFSTSSGTKALVIEAGHNVLVTKSWSTCPLLSTVSPDVHRSLTACINESKWFLLLVFTLVTRNPKNNCYITG